MTVVAVLDEAGKLLGIFTDLNVATASVKLTYSQLGEVRFEPETSDQERVVCPDGHYLTIRTLQPKSLPDHL